jgi:hypothetical protein
VGNDRDLARSFQQGSRPPDLSFHAHPA